MITKPSFNEIFMDLAQNLALRSHCTRAQVGCVLTKDTRIISIGYNGPPSGTHNCDEDFKDEGGCPKDSKGSCSLALHAGQNAILYASKNGASIEAIDPDTSLESHSSESFKRETINLNKGSRSTFEVEKYRRISPGNTHRTFRPIS